MKLLFSTLCAALLVCKAVAAPFEFFPFDSGVGRGKPEWTPDRQADTLKKLGYDGIGYNYTTPEALAAWQKAMDARGLKIYSIYLYTMLGKTPAYPANLEAGMRILEGRDTVIWITIFRPKENGKEKAVKPGEMDDEAVKIVQEVCAMAKKHHLQVALYGHKNLYIETAEDGVRVVEKANCDNLGASFNLCHELMHGNEKRLHEIIRKCAPHLTKVSVNGADLATKRYVLRLDQGDFDVAGIVRTLKDSGYKGTVGLQCYMVPGEVEENLKADMDAWRKIVAKVFPDEAKP